MKTNEMRLHGDKTRAQWDRLWVRIPGGLKDYQPDLRHKVGLYRMRQNGRDMAIGLGTDKRGGMAKRLSDFFRPSSSSRDHYVGRKIYDNRHLLSVEVLITGSDKDARELAKELKKFMIHHHRPEWNRPGLHPRRAKTKAKVRVKANRPQRPTRPYRGVVPPITKKGVQSKA